MGAYRSRNVLDLLFSHILEREIEFVTNLIAHDPADAYSARWSQRFKAGRDHVDVTPTFTVSLAPPMLEKRQKTPSDRQQ